MLEETRQKLSILDLVEAPMKSYTVPIPKDGTIYDYRFLKVSIIRAAFKLSAIIVSLTLLFEQICFCVVCNWVAKKHNLQPDQFQPIHSLLMLNLCVCIAGGSG